MRRLLLYLVLIFATAATTAQVTIPPKTTVGNLPACDAAHTTRIIGVTDGASASDCSVGGGSAAVVCTCDGSSWSAIGSGSASITVKEEDSAPNVSGVSEIRVSNGTLTDNGGGSVSISTGGGGGGGDAIQSASGYTSVETDRMSPDDGKIWFAAEDGTPSKVDIAELYKIPVTGDNSGVLKMPDGSLNFVPSYDSVSTDVHSVYFDRCLQGSYRSLKFTWTDHDNGACTDYTTEQVLNLYGGAFAVVNGPIKGGVGVIPITTPAALYPFYAVNTTATSGISKDGGVGVVVGGGTVAEFSNSSGQATAANYIAIDRATSSLTMKPTTNFFLGDPTVGSGGTPFKLSFGGVNLEYSPNDSGSPHTLTLNAIDNSGGTTVNTTISSSNGGGTVTITNINATTGNVGGGIVNVNGLTADASPVGSTDYVMTYDASAAANKKVLLDNLPGGGGGAPVDAEYLTSAADATLTAERVFQSGANTTFTTGAGTAQVDVADAASGTKGVVRLAGDLGGSASSPTVTGLQTRAVASTAPTDGQVLKWNNAGSQWEPGAAGSASFTSFDVDYGDETVTSAWDLSGAKVILPSGTTPPSADCDADAEKGRVYVDTDATSGQQLYVCEGATNGWVLQGDGGGSSVSVVNKPLLHVQDQQTDGTDAGGATSGSWQTRVLNTSVTNEITGASLSSNQVTLPAGTFYVRASCPAFEVGHFQIRLRNTSDSSTTLVGTSEQSTSTDTVTTRSWVIGRFTIAASKTFEIQMRVATTKATNGWGTAGSFGEHETYCDASFWQIDGDSSEVAPYGQYDPDNPPSTCDKCEEWTGDSAAQTWTWGNQSTATETLEMDTALLSTTSTSDNRRFRCTAAPSGDFTVSTKLSWAGPVHGSNGGEGAGLGFIDGGTVSSPTRIVMCDIIRSGGTTNSFQYSSASASSYTASWSVGDSFLGSRNEFSTWYIRARYDATNDQVTCGFSSDGMTWRETSPEAFSNGDPPYYCYMADASNGMATPGTDPLEARFFFVRERTDANKDQVGE